MSLIQPSVSNLKNLADSFPRGEAYEFAQGVVVERDGLIRRLNALLGSFLEIKQGQDPIIKAQIRGLPGSVFNAGSIDGRVIAGRLNKAVQSFNATIDFSATDFDTVAWTSGTIRFVDGAQYAISSGNTGNMTAHTFIFFDPAISTSVLQVTTDYTDTLGENAILLCNAEDAPTSDLEAFFVSYKSVNLNVNQLSVNYLSALSANMGDLTAGTITLSDANSYIRLGTTPPTSATVGTGLWIDRTGLYGLASNVQKFILSATTGELTATGKIRTALSGARIEISYTTDGAIEFYDNTDTLAAYIKRVGDPGGYTEISGEVRLTSTITQVGLTTLCTNLNADMVDGKNVRQANGAAVTAGTNNITFSSTIGTTNYSLFARIFNANNEQLGFKVKTKSATGFTVEDVYESGTLEYIAIG